MFLRRISKRLSKILQANGRRVSRWPLMTYLRDFEIDCVFDVGANVGQYASELREFGFQGRIESFEPLPTVLPALHTKAQKDTNWNVHEYALGSENSRSSIHISANSPSSSFLSLDEKLDAGNLNLTDVGTAEVEIRKLDSVFGDLRQNSRNFFLKVDTQGFERHVIEGASQSLCDFQMVQLECSLVPTYIGETLIEDMIRLMRQNGFVPWWLMDGFRHNRTLQLYQADVIFARCS